MVDPLRCERGGGYSFPGAEVRGGVCATPRAAQIVSRQGRRAGIAGVTPHVLRHIFCKSLVDAGDSLDRVAVLAGHSNLDTTAGPRGPLSPAWRRRWGSSIGTC